MEGVGMNSRSSMVVSNQRKEIQRIKFDNPFTFKVGQVFTGFGVGCGVGIGVGRPINMGALPMVGQVMSATRGATDAFSGVSRHVNDALRKVGAKNIETGIGCGVGFGHGFGIGFAIKPSAMNQIQAYLAQAVTKLTAKLGAVAPNLPISQGAASPVSLQSGLTTMNQPSIQSPFGSVMQVPPIIPNHPFQALSEPGSMASVMQLPPNIPNHPFQATSSPYGNLASGSPVESSFGRTENVINSFLQSPLLKENDSQTNKLGLQSENNMLKMVLKHQERIEELMKENEKLRQILVDDLKVSPSKLQTSHYTSKTTTSCSECFECRRKQRRR